MGFIIILVVISPVVILLLMANRKSNEIKNKNKADKFLAEMYDEKHKKEKED